MIDRRVDSLADPRRWSALTVLLAGGFLPPLDFNVVNLALPAIAQDLHATASQLELVMTAYTCTYAVLLITGGRLGDRFGRRMLFVVGVAMFTGASLACGLAGSAALLIVGRALQAAGASLLAPQVIASIRDLFPAKEQPVAISLYGAAFGLAFVAGQVFGGFVIELRLLGLTWQPVFLINVPLGVAVLIGAFTLVRNTRQLDPVPLDISGVLICSATLFSLIYPLVSGRESGWPAWQCALLGISMVLAVAFYFWELHVARTGGVPLVDFTLMRAPSMLLGVPVALCFYTTSAVFFVVPEYLQSGLHFDAFHSALRMLPLCLSYFAVSMLSTRMSSGLGARGLLIGLCILVAGMAGVIICARAPLALGFYVGQVLIGSGFGLLMPSIVGTLVGGLDRHHAGLASGIVLSSLQIGAALGVALFAGVYFAVLDDGPGQSTHLNALRLALTLNTIPLIIAIGLATKLVRLDGPDRKDIGTGRIFFDPQQPKHTSPLQ